MMHAWRVALVVALIGAASANPQQGTCMLQLSSGNISPSRKACSQCQWDCLTDPVHCTGLTFDLAPVSLAQLPSWDCGDGYWLSASPGLCVLVGANDVIFDTQEQGCTECLSQCLHDSRCQYTIYNYVRYPKEASTCSPPTPPEVPSSPLAPVDIPPPPPAALSPLVIAAASPDVPVPLPPPSPEGSDVGDLSPVYRASPSPEVPPPSPEVPPPSPEVPPPSPEVPPPSPEVPPPSPEIPVELPPSSPDASLVADLSPIFVPSPAPEGPCIKPVSMLPVPGDAQAECKIFGAGGNVIASSFESCEQCQWQCLTWGTTASDCTGISFGGSPTIMRIDLVYGLCPASYNNVIGDAVTPSTYGLCVLKLGGLIYDTQMMTCATCVEQCKTWPTGCEAMIFNTDLVPASALDSYCECPLSPQPPAPGRRLMGA